MKTTNQSFQVITYALALLFTLAFVAPVVAQDQSTTPATTGSSWVSTIFDYFVKFLTWTFTWIANNFGAITDFFVKYIWPIVKQVASAIWGYFYPSSAGGN
ncbi:hypothetical protein CONCODRAFT_12249 [Conidiobolus coronatus NRRL 28638]|uniref:Uncharacterized protein n=1 Tax=Conidiobolus coronatus (strain ATCC 28846 / CBS 209.66 / NRRL 28638) TaxID=796925 RepID=A0A137NTF2_CONC2|nr:hypothetical protein CONCODRAFT_12249 [Conidiobolus coronatus NRRL 28638]|eukprot:KXN66009.1 hypothetical protein CONCODRAFT_12249 [Conidiobolus coronatus NRRL 28638]